jgi:hypothetical protein
MTEPPDRGPEPDIEIEAVLAAHGFLLEVAFALICELRPEGRQEAFRRIETSLLGMLGRSPANPDALTARAVKVSDETERQLRIFLARLRLRVRA